MSQDIIEKIFWMVITSNAVLITILGKMVLEWIRSKKPSNNESQFVKLKEQFTQMNNNCLLHVDKLKQLETLKELTIVNNETLKQILQTNNDTKELIKLFTTALIKTRLEGEEQDGK